MRFQFRPVLTVAALIGLAILISLGTWQVQRLQWKEDLIAKVEARLAAEPIPFAQAYARWQAGEDMEYTPVKVQLTYDHSLEAHVFGTWEEAVGWYVFTPGVVSAALPRDASGGTVLYINRGFTPDDFKVAASRTDGLITTDGRLVVTGLLRTPQKRPAIAGSLTPANNPERNEWHVRDPLVFAEAAGLTSFPVWIDSSGAESPAEWPKGGTTRVEFNNRHLEYALTWFGLAATLIAVFVAFSLRSKGSRNTGQ